jgi:hypothetical protein
VVLRRLIPGYRMFVCEYCGNPWQEPSRDCHSPSGEHCPDEVCVEFNSPSGYEEHPEWPTDASGNLLPGHALGVPTQRDAEP